MRAATVLPPIGVVLRHEGRFHTVDGDHRHAACILVGYG